MTTQWYVDLSPVKFPLFRNRNYALWKLSPDGISEMLANIKGLTWTKANDTKMAYKTSKGYHSTAIRRFTPPAPLQKYLDTYNPLLRVGGYMLYHGVGKDDVGWRAISSWSPFSLVTAFDPYHPNTEIQKKPNTNTFDEIFSIYVLNVVDKKAGYQIFEDLLTWLKPHGHAIIAVRKDL